VLRCPRGHKAISGYYYTDGFIAADWFASGATARKWEYGFFDTFGANGEATAGIVCLKT
jgi:hypothetical protein